MHEGSSPSLKAEKDSRSLHTEHKSRDSDAFSSQPYISRSCNWKMRLMLKLRRAFRCKKISQGRAGRLWMNILRLKWPSAIISSMIFFSWFVLCLWRCNIWSILVLFSRFQFTGDQIETDLESPMRGKIMSCINTKHQNSP